MSPVRARAEGSSGRSSSWAALAAALAAGVTGCGASPIESVSISGRGLAAGLVAHWSFDETSGMDLVDRSGNGHNGQISGNTWSWVTNARFAGGLRLQPGDSITIPNFPNATPDWTVSVWIKQSLADQATFTMERSVLLTAERPGAGGWEIEFDPRPGFEWLEASYYVAPPTNDYVIPQCRCIDTGIDRWTQFTAVFDWTNQHRVNLYHNGLLADSPSMPAAILPGDANLGVGRWTQGPRSLSGIIDDFAIWSRALSGDEVATLYARPAPDSL